MEGDGKWEKFKDQSKGLRKEETWQDGLHCWQPVHLFACQHKHQNQHCQENLAKQWSVFPCQRLLSLLRSCMLSGDAEVAWWILALSFVEAHWHPSFVYTEGGNMNWKVTCPRFWPQVSPHHRICMGIVQSTDFWFLISNRTPLPFRSHKRGHSGPWKAEQEGRRACSGGESAREQQRWFVVSNSPST